MPMNFHCAHCGTSARVAYVAVASQGPELRELPARLRSRSPLHFGTFMSIASVTAAWGGPELRTCECPEATGFALSLPLRQLREDCLRRLRRTQVRLCRRSCDGDGPLSVRDDKLNLSLGIGTYRCLCTAIYLHDASGDHIQETVTAFSQFDSRRTSNEVTETSSPQ